MSGVQLNGGESAESLQQQQAQPMSTHQTLLRGASISAQEGNSARNSLSRGNLLASLAEASASATLPYAASTAGGNTTATIKPRSQTQGREESGEASDEGTDDGDNAGEVFGNLKTTLVWDTAGRRLCLSARQYVETSRRLEMKARGVLDTASGQHRVWGHARRNFYTHVPLLQRLLTAQSQRQAGGWVDEPDLDPEGLLPGGLRSLLFQDWVIAPGLSYDTARAPACRTSAPSTATSAGGAAAPDSAPAPATPHFGRWGPVSLPGGLGQGVRYQLAIKKNPQVIRNSGAGDLWLTARALAEYDPAASELTLGGSIRLKAARYGVTAGGQDLRLSLGLDVAADEAGRFVQTPYLHLSDGKLGAKLQHRRWQLSYAL